MAKRTAEFVLSAKDETSSVLAKVQGQVKGLGGAFGLLGKVAAPALAALGIGLSIHGVAEFIVQANDLTGAMEDSSNRTGIAIDKLQAYQHAAKLAGIEAESLDGLLIKLNKTAGEIKINQSAEATVAAFKRIHISVQEVKTSDPAELFERVIEGLGGIQDPAVRSTLAMQIFGKSGATALTLVNDGVDSLRRSSELLKKTGLGLTADDLARAADAADRLDDLKFIIQSAKQKLAADLSPAIATVEKMFISAAEAGGGIGPAIHNGVAMAVTAVDRLYLAGTTLVNGFQGVQYTLIGIWDKAGAAVLKFAALVTDGIGGDGPRALNYFITASNDGLTNLKQDFANFGTSIANSVIAAMNKAGEGTTKFFNQAVGQINALIAKGNELANTHFEMIPTISWKGFDTLKPPTVDPVQIPLVPVFADDAVKKLRDQAQTLSEFGNANFDFGSGAFKAAGDAFNALIGDGGELQKQFNAAQSAATQTKKKITEDYTGGSGMPAKVKEELGKMGGVAVNTFSLMEEYGKSFTSSLEKSIDDFTKTGELSFKSFAASVLQEMAAISMKAAILGGILGNSKYGGTGSILGFGSNSTWGQTLSGLFSGFSGVPKAREVSPQELFKTYGISYDGGGFTGFGSRSGGADGKGGFPALLHPNETVVDHARGQSVGGNTTVHQTVVIREVMPAGQARAIQQAAASAAVSQVSNINDRGGQRAKRFNGRR